MLQSIKKQLIENVDALENLLSYYGFDKFKRNNRELRFARDDNPNSGLNISIRLENNDYINVQDYARATRCDVISYIIQEKGATFREVLKQIKNELGLDDSWSVPKKVGLFNGLYDKIYNKTSYEPKTYDESILNQYDNHSNLLWLKDGISLEAMRFYDVRFDIVENAIVFPWRDGRGQIIAIKSRHNGEPPEGYSKYYYPIPGNISYSLFNYSQCYEHLYHCNKLFVLESEKSCMKLWGWGIKSTVALGSHSLSSEQAKMILQLQPKEVIFMLDSDLDLAETKKNADMLRNYAAMMQLKISYWDWTYNLDLPSKSAPCDGIKEDWDCILANEIEDISNLEEENEI